jgi:hypothetical protein
VKITLDRKEKKLHLCSPQTGERKGVKAGKKGEPKNKK